MAKDKSPRRPKAEGPKGFRDDFGAEVTARREMLARIAEVYERYGFDPLETPALETVEALGKFLPDVDRPNEGVFAWEEDAGWLALRYDLTAPLARVAAQYRSDLPSPYRRYAMGPVWRNEKPGPGRFRQFYQCDADTVGAPSVAADAEICMMLADTLEAVGIDRGDYVIRVNDRKVLNGVLEKAGLLDLADPSRFEAERGIVLRAIDKLDRLGVEGVRALLGEGRTDESGDRTEGAKLRPAQIGAIMTYVDVAAKMRDQFEDVWDSKDGRTAFGVVKGRGRKASGDDGSRSLGERAEITNLTACDHFRAEVNLSQVGLEGVDELMTMSEYCAAQGYEPDRIRIDPCTVRGLGYYTGPVYEAELTFEITDEKGRPQRFGSVAGGGRYDDLVKRFTGQTVPATGVSIGVDRLLAALQAKALEKARAEGRTPEVGTPGPVVVTVMDRDRMADYMAMAGELRASTGPDGGNDLRAEVYLGNPRNFGNQLRYADKRRSPIAVIQGAEELAEGMVILKDLIQGAEIAETATLEEWKDRPAQKKVPRADLVAEVRKMLGRPAR